MLTTLPRPALITCLVLCLGTSCGRAAERLRESFGQNSAPSGGEVVKEFLVAEQDGFKIKLPATIERVESTREGSTGTLTSSTYKCAVLIGKTAARYTITRQEFDRTIEDPATSTPILDGFRDLLLKNNEKGTLERDVAITLNSHPGREVWLKHGEGRYIMRFYLRGNVAYQVSVSFGTASPSEMASIVKTLDSFEFIEHSHPVKQ